MTDTRKVFSRLQGETALCIWEWLLENCQTKNVDKKDGVCTSWADYRGKVGYVALRSGAIETFAPWVLKVYDAGKAADANAWDAWAYDWDVVPAIMRQIPFDHLGLTLPLPTDYALAARIALAALDDQERRGKVG